MSLLKRTALATLISCSLTPIAAGAVGLGEIRVTSRLGDRFHAEIPLVNSSAEVIPSCFNLTTQASDSVADVPWLKDAQIALMSSPPRLVINSRRQVSDPIIQLAVYTGCGTYLTRHYTAFLSPAEEVKELPTAALIVAGNSDIPLKATRAEAAGRTRSTARSGNWRTARAGETASDMARRLYPQSRRNQQRFVRELVALNPEWLSSESADETLPEGVALRYPNLPPRPVEAVRPKVKPAVKISKPESTSSSSDRLVLMPSDESLPAEKSAAPVTSGEISNRLSDVEQQIVAMRSQLTTLHAEYPTPPPAIQTVLVEMESRLLAVELNVARIKLSSLSAEAQAKASTPTTQAEPTANDKVVAAPAPASTAAVSPPALKPEASKPVPAADQGQPYAFGTGMALLGIFGLGLGTYLFRRARRVKEVMAPVTVLTVPSPDAVSPVREAQAPAPATPLDLVVDEGTNGNNATYAPTSTRKEARKEELDFSPIELANIMLSFGRAQGAVEVLQDFIRDNPTESLQPGLRLLEIYKQTEMRREFEQLAGQLARRFNVERVHWNQEFLPATEASAVSIDSSRGPTMTNVMPTHIKARIAANWGTSECLDYLHTLLSDTRGGARKGFSVLVTQEILAVIKTLEAQLKSRKTA